jgi:hypothetical protein
VLGGRNVEELDRIRVPDLLLLSSTGLEAGFHESARSLMESIITRAHVQRNGDEW